MYITGSWYWDGAIIFVCWAIWWMGILKTMKPEVKAFTGGSFIYRDFVGDTRALNRWFSKIGPDMADYRGDFPAAMEHPFAAIFHNDTNGLTQPIH